MKQVFRLALDLTRPQDLEDPRVAIGAYLRTIADGLVHHPPNYGVVKDDENGTVGQFFLGPDSLEAPAIKMWIGLVKFPKEPRKRTWRVYRYCIVAPDRDTALALLKAEHAHDSEVAMHYHVRATDESVIKRDVYWVDDGDPFDKDDIPPMESPLFGG